MAARRPLARPVDGGSIGPSSLYAYSGRQTGHVRLIATPEIVRLSHDRLSAHCNRAILRRVGVPPLCILRVREPSVQLSDIASFSADLAFRDGDGSPKHGVRGGVHPSRKSSRPRRPRLTAVNGFLGRLSSRRYESHRTTLLKRLESLDDRSASARGSARPRPRSDCRCRGGGDSSRWRRAAAAPPRQVGLLDIRSFPRTPLHSR